MTLINPLSAEDFQYELPQNAIAKEPLKQRDLSKLLVYQKGEIQHQVFQDLPNFLEKNTLLVFNDSKVIPARLLFQKSTGATIEILLINPFKPLLMALSLQSQVACEWKCIIGNKKKWKNQEVLILELEGIELKAELVQESLNIVRFSWNPEEISFAEIVEKAGNMPLPPYLQRLAHEGDKHQYQTVYAKNKGAAAAPTAGLHFTDKVFQDLAQKKILTEFLTLHVSAGTFQPIKEKELNLHPMHAEQVIFTKQNIEKVLNHQGKIVAVGTTSMRSLETLFWLGQLVHTKNMTLQEFYVEQYTPYDYLNSPSLLTVNQSLETILTQMEKENISEFWGETEIFIFPPYRFQVCKGLITNYHLPGSTLILLVAAFVGEDWRKIYQEALNNQYRFLSYGDSSLLLP